MPRASFLLALAAALLAAGCSATDDDRPVSTFTAHQRDSVLARSDLPGARVVGGALEASELAAGHAALADSVLRAR